MSAVGRPGRRAVRWGNVALGAVGACMFAAGIAFFALSILLSGCAPSAVVDEASPRATGASVAAGSDLTESSQYVEVRLTFDRALEAAGEVRDDLDVRVNGEQPDARTIAVEAAVEGSDVVVRLVPTSAADGASSSVYFALYDGLVSVAARADGGGLPHVRVEGGGSNAVLDEGASFTVPSGVRVGAVEAEAADAATGALASVSFDVEEFAQLRCVTWFSFGAGLPPVMMHNHEFLRDTPQTCAKRLADTVNANYGDDLEAEAHGARVTVRALAAADGTALGVALAEGAGVDPRAGGAAAPASALVSEGGGA